MFKYSVIGFLLSVCSVSGLEIKGQDVDKLQPNGKNQFIYQYDDQNNTLSLECSKHELPGRYSTLQFIKGEKILQETAQAKINYIFKLYKNDSNSVIKCLDKEVQNEENIRLYEKKGNDLSINIRLLYISTVKSEDDNKLDDNKNNSSDSYPLETSTDSLKGKYTDKEIDGSQTNIIFGLIGLLVAFLIILMIILHIQRLRKKKKREDKIHLQITESQIISQNTEPVTFNDTYINPSDDNSYEDPSLNLAIPQTYCTPYIGNGDVYAEPIPKQFRTVKNTVNYVNTVKPGSRTLEVKKPISNRNINHTLPKQTVQVEDYIAPSDASYQDVYSEVNS